MLFVITFLLIIYIICGDIDKILYKPLDSSY